MKKISALVHFFPPWRCAGSETVAVELLKAAAQAGHEVRVWVTHQDAQRTWRGTEPDTELDGMTIHRVRNPLIAGSGIRQWRPDVVTSHHDHASYAIKLARSINARSAFLVHNSFDLNRRPLQLNPSLTIFNSDWVEKDLARFGSTGESLTMHPPLTPERHLVDKTGESVTLINLNKDKGAETFYELARQMPDTPFLGVVGGHGVQVPAPKLPNLTVLEHGPEMRRVWSQTRVLLMPSVAESYGLTAVEAAINGIPTVAHPTPGLKENLGAGGLFCDRDKTHQWVRQLRLLEHPDVYAEASEYARNLGEQALKESSDTLKKWCDWLGQ